TDQRPSNDPEALADAAAAAGLEPAKAREILASDAFADEVRAEEEQWRANGIQAVPSVIFNQRWLIQGAQPPHVFAQAIRDIVSGAAQIGRASWRESGADSRDVGSETMQRGA